MICNIDNHVPGSQGGILFGNLGAQYDNMVTCTLCGSYHTLQGKQTLKQGLREMRCDLGSGVLRTVLQPDQTDRTYCSG